MREEKKVSKKQPVKPVKASGLTDVTTCTEQLREAAASAGFRTEAFAAVAGHPLLAMTKRVSGQRPRFYLSAGCHGDEPAGTAALLRLLKNGFFDDRATWFLCPLLNPTGMETGTRENTQGIDLNRDYLSPQTPEIQGHVGWLQRQPRFDLALCLHEDWETSGFYVYELNTRGLPSQAGKIVAAVRQVCPIELAELIDGRSGKDGIIRPVDDPLLRNQWPEAIYLRAHHTGLSYTTETPSARDLALRVEAQCRAIAAAVEAELSIPKQCSAVPSGA